MVTREERYAAAFTVVFESRFPELLRYLVRLTGEPALAADIAQETFVRLYERGTTPENVRGWLVTVAHNLFRDGRRRSSRRERLIELKAATEPQFEDPRAAEDTVDAEAERQRVRNALDQLPERDRRLLLLRHEGYSYRELSTALEIAEV
ncbi:MAG: RNA polymerase sigma factor, partial [Gemmatimonadaceae bacterium]